MIALVQVFNSHVRIVFQPDVVSDLQEEIVRSDRLYSERYPGQSKLNLVPIVELVADPPVFQHGPTEVLAVKAVVGTEQDVTVRSREFEI